MEFRVGDARDLAAVVSILDDAAGWLWRSGLRQWPERFIPEWVMPALQHRETWLALVDTVPVGTFTVSWQDDVWPDYPDDGGYIHRIAVLRSAAGIGPQLIEHVCSLVLAEHRRFVRLDCVATNDALRRYYERAGFHHCGDVEVPLVPGERLIGGGDAVVVSRYERAIG